MSFRFVVVGVLAIGLVGCAADVGEGKARAVVEDVPAAEVAAPVAPGASGELPVPVLSSATLLDVDAAQSRLGVVGAKVTAKHPINFPDFAGKVGLDGDAVTGIAFAAKIATLETSPERLQEHLKKPDFLDAEKFPHATFVSTEVKAGSDQAGFTHTVTGDLSIHGKTKRVTFPATITLDPGKVDAKTEFVIDRRDFDVVYAGKADDLVQDNVLMQVSFVAKRT